MDWSTGICKPLHLVPPKISSHVCHMTWNFSYVAKKKNYIHLASSKFYQKRNFKTGIPPTEEKKLSFSSAKPLWTESIPK